MGRSKAMLPFGFGEVMLQRVVRLVGEAASSIVVVAAPDQELPALPESIRVVRDSVADRGPLQGIAAGLDALPPEIEFAYATATDVPFLAPEWIRLLRTRIGDAGMAIPFVGGFHHPLSALYRRLAVLGPIAELLATDRLRPFFLIEAVGAVILGEDELRAVDPKLATLRNLNTQSDYEDALAEAGATSHSRGSAVIVEFFGTVRLRAGVASIAVEAETLGEALARLSEELPALSGTVVVGGRVHRAFRASLNGARFVTEPTTALVPGDHVLILAADAGG